MSEDSSPVGLDGCQGLLRAALDAFDDLFFVFGGDGNFLHWNRAVVDVTGYSDDELAGMAVDEFVAESDAEPVRNAVAEVLEHGQARVEVGIVTADGDQVPYEVQVVRLTDDAGREMGVAGIGRAITERREAERQRRAIIDRMTDAFFALDEEWRFTYVNEQAQPILASAMGEDLSSDEMEGLHHWDAIPEAVDTPFYEKYHEAMETQETVELEEYYEPLDTWFAVRAYPSETGLSVYFRDITEQRRQRTALENRERVLREIYEVTADADMTFSDQVDALMAIGCDVLGTKYATLSRIEGEDYVFEAVRAPDDSFGAGDTVPLSATHCERTAAEEQTLVIADVARDAPKMAERDGYTEWGIACYLGAPVVVDGAVYGTFCFYDDEPRTETFSEWEQTVVDIMSQWVSYELTRQRTRERLERQNDQLEEFASIVSHDLRNPLTVLSGSLELAEETGDPEHFEKCYKAVERMEVLIEDVLTLAQAGKRITDPEPISMAPFLEECWTGVATADATLVVATDRTMTADRSRLRQLVENLVRNAVEHGGESVTVTVGDLDDVSASEARGGSTDESVGGFYVEDDGPGIPEDERPDVFDAGYSTAADGTGFGLNIVKQVADAHGWDVHVAASATGGSRFEFTGVETA